MTIKNGWDKNKPRKKWTWAHANPVTKEGYPYPHTAIEWYAVQFVYYQTKAQSSGRITATVIEVKLWRVQKDGNLRPCLDWPWPTTVGNRKVRQDSNDIIKRFKHETKSQYTLGGILEQMANLRQDVPIKETRATKFGNTWQSPVNLQLKGCPRCGGDLSTSQDEYGTVARCLQCGYNKDVSTRNENTTGRLLALRWSM